MSKCGAFFPVSYAQLDYMFWTSDAHNVQIMCIASESSQLNALSVTAKRPEDRTLFMGNEL